MKTSKLVLISVLASVSLAVYVLEGLIPPVVAIPGVKLGLANAITLISMYIIGNGGAFAVLCIRIVISSLFFAHPMALLFSISGGVLSYAVMCVLKRFVSSDNIWALSIFGALAHNTAQIILAVFITGHISVFYYFLFLAISSVLTGFFTGICAQYTIKKIKKIF